jgi:hypothetical protein
MMRQVVYTMPAYVCICGFAYVCMFVSLPVYVYAGCQYVGRLLLRLACKFAEVFWAVDSKERCIKDCLEGSELHYVRIYVCVCLYIYIYIYICKCKIT